MRASDLIAKENEKQAEILGAKDEQVSKMEEFIRNAREVLRTEFKALSSDVLKDASTELTRAADGIIEKHGEQTVADIKVHQKHIETLLKPVEETIRRLDKHDGCLNAPVAPWRCLIWVAKAKALGTARRRNLLPTTPR